MDKKTLVLYDSIEYFIPFMENEDIEIYRLYKKKGKFVTLLKKACIKLNIFSSIWYHEWINKLGTYDKIIVFATTDYTFINKIKKDYPDIKVIFWYWNPAFRMGLPRKNLFNMADVWSFDPSDCEKYNLKFNTTFYFKNITVNNSAQIDNDILFLGINKGRRAFLENLDGEFSKLGLKTYFHIVPDKKEKGYENIKPVSYQEYLNLISKSNCILDIMPIGQSGLTLRPMESIFLKRKLITNDVLIKNYDFYRPENIFIIGEDDINDLKAFVESPYIEIDAYIVLKYDFSNWIKRFDAR